MPALPRISIVLIFAFLQVIFHSSSSAEPLSCACGTTFNGRSTRVVGGSEAAAGKYPWMAAVMGEASEPFCAAVIINDRYALTAATCLRSRKPEDIRLLIGVHNYKKQAKTSVLVPVETLIEHADYRGIGEYDIGLIKLKEPLKLESSASQLISPVCLSEGKTDVTGKILTVIGWGQTGEGSSTSEVLREADVQVSSLADCQRAYADIKNVNITEKLVCAGWPEGGRDACTGDTGGPLLMKNEKELYEAVGLVSFGKGCARPGFPGVYTNVNAFLPWIQEHTKDAKWCGSATA